MATGANWIEGATVGLWHLNYKINTPERGYNFKLHMAQVNEATALAGAVDLSTRLRYVMPTDSNIFYATIAKDDTKKDSRFIRSALGEGLYEVTGPPSETTYDFPSTALLVRLEHADGGSVTRKFCPLPDDQVSSALLVNAISDVTDPVVALPAAPSVATAFATNFNNLLKAIIFSTHHVKAGHEPGGTYDYFAWSKAYPLRIGLKKGGRVFA